MNGISTRRHRGALPPQPPRILRRQIVLFAACLAACGSPAPESTARADPLLYRLSYHVIPTPARHLVDVEMTLTQERHLLREMRFDAAAVSDIRGDGQIEFVDGSLRWLPPKRGGNLSWRTIVRNERNGSGYDAWLDRSWGLFRAEDIIPRASTRTLKGAIADTRLSFELPRDWSVVTQYASRKSYFPVVTDGRRFSQPSGWIVLGDLGVRRDRIAGVKVAIAAPENQRVRRLDMLALLNWTLPELARVLPDLPRRLTIVSAGDPMWRGGLSAPQSAFIHADRPLISENGTSTLLHEIMHVALAAKAADGFDWIIEGLAEYYSLELLRRSSSLSAKRHARALAWQTDWSESADRLCSRTSSGARTALAVVTLHRLDSEIRSATGDKSGLDDVLAGMLESGKPFDLDLLLENSIAITGQKPDALDIARLPGCVD